MRVAEDLPLIRRILDGLFDLVRLSVRFEVYGMSEILHPFQNARYCAVVPSIGIVGQSTAHFPFLLVLIDSRCQHLFLFEYMGDLCRTITIHA